jgi:hypothetical protein
MVVATASPRAEMAALLVARRRGIRSVCITDMLIEYCNPTVAPYIVQPGYGSALCVLTDSVRGYLVERGRPAHEIAVTGNPAFDVYADASLGEKAAAVREQRGWTGLKLILYASQRNPDRPEEPLSMGRELARLTRTRPGWHLLVRPHPNEDPHPGGLPDWATLVSGEPLPPLLAACDVLVTSWSTVALEAALLGKPVVTLDFLHPPERRFFSAHRVSIGSASLETLGADLDAALRHGRHGLAGMTPPGSAVRLVHEAIARIAAGAAVPPPGGALA